MDERYYQYQHAQLLRQQQLGHYMLLATVIATVVNIALLLGNATFYIPYSAALPYYLTVLGFYFDGNTLSTYTATGMVMAFVALAVWLLVWYLARGSRRWLRVGMILVILDTVMLALFAFGFLADPAGCLLEGVIHIVAIYEISRGLSAYKQMDQLQTKFAQAQAEQALFQEESAFPPQEAEEEIEEATEE